MYLFDSNILINLSRRRPHPAIFRRFAEVPFGAGTTSALVVMELRSGTARTRNPVETWQDLESHLLKQLTVLDFSREDALVAADIDADLARLGRTLPQLDLMIGATARRHGLTLVTGNVKDFADIPGLKIENWFD